MSSEVLKRRLSTSGEPFERSFCFTTRGCTPRTPPNWTSPRPCPRDGDLRGEGRRPRNAGTGRRRPLPLLCPWNSPGKNTGVSCCAPLHRIFPTQGLNPGLPHCWRILYCLSHQGSPLNLEKEYLNPEWWCPELKRTSIVVTNDDPFYQKLWRG